MAGDRQVVSPISKSWLDRTKTFVGRWLPFATRSRHRHILGFLQSRGYQAVDVLAWERTYRLRKNGRDYVFKRQGSNGLVAYRDVLPAIRGEFVRLAVPRFVESGCHRRFRTWIIAEWLPGRTFNDRCDDRDPSTSGGKTIPLDYVEPVVDLLADLRTIDARGFAASGLEMRSRSFLCPRLRRQLDESRARGLVSPRQERRLFELLEPFLDGVDSGTLRISNHDFNFRNFVELPGGRVAVVDWDAARISTYEIEHCVTYLWMLMWNHPEWAKAFLTRAAAILHLDRRVFRAALLINALNQAMRVWPERPELRDIMLATFANALDDAWFDTTCAFG